MVQVRGGQHRLPVLVERHVGTIYKTVSSQNLLVFRIPNDELAVGNLHGVVWVNIGFQPRSTAVMTKGNFPKPPHLSHQVR